ncbi:MAG: hypothetical protein KA792_00705 [Bacteroidales bacterium]|nr:hypothetical protein [Bacteroidales bacterium]
MIKIDFRLRGNYRNYNLLRYFIKARKTSEREETPKGFLSSEVDYRDIDGQLKTITTNFEETHFISQPDTDKATEFLFYLLSARNGDIKAKQIISELTEKYYKEKESYCANLQFIENSYIIPSISNNKYSLAEISHKGSILLDLVQEGYPVPDFCIISSAAYSLSYNERKTVIRQAIKNLEMMTGLSLGSYGLPLVFAIRCAMPMQIPGLMPTYLNVGVTIKSYMALKEIYGPLVASKIYLNNLKTIFSLLGSKSDLPEFFNDIKEDSDATINYKIKFYYKVISEKDDRLLWDPYYQVHFFINQARIFYKHNKELLYTFIKEKQACPSFILQKMVWTVRGDDSYPGVIYSRHSRTGIGVQIESMRNIFGEEIMTGNITAEDDEYLDRSEIKNKFPAIYHFHPLLVELERKIQSPATIEFAVESGKQSSLFAVLQLNASELTGRATLLSTIELNKLDIIPNERVVELVRPYHLKQIFSERIDDRSFKNLEFFSFGISILPRSAVTAKIYFSATAALEAKKKGENVCFCKETFQPTDTIVMGEVDAIISLNPVAIHVVTACRGFGIPALIDLRNNGVQLVGNTLYNAKGMKINETEVVTISSKNKALFKGSAKFKPARFQKYLLGEKIELDEKEEKVFRNMATTFKTYQVIVNSIDQSKIVNISELAKIIRNDLKDNPGKASDFLNKWFDIHKNEYVEQILQSELGSHQEQHTLYNLLSKDRKIVFFKNVISISQKRELKGFTAGSFMLGRFICIRHPMVFWQSLTPGEIAFLLNEFVYFQKYIQVLNDVGEHNLYTARKKILKDGLDIVNIGLADVKTFITLKLAKPDWKKVISAFNFHTPGETLAFADLLQTKPFGFIYNYDKAWEMNELKEICSNEKIPFPTKEDV